MSGKTNIAIIEPVGGHGGMDMYVYGLAQELGRSKTSVSYFTCTETKIQEMDEVETYLTFKDVWSKTNKILRLFYYLKSYIRTLRQIKNLKINIVHLHFFDLNLLNLMSLVLIRMKGFKVVVTIHDVEGFVQKPKPAIERLCLKRIDHLIVHNTFSKAQLESKKYKLPPLSVIPHGNYINMITVDDVSLAFNGPFKILFFGQIKEVKGLDILLNALAELKKRNIEVKLTIAGKFWKTDPEKYLNLIKEKKIENLVTLESRYIPNEEVHRFFEDSNLVVLPYRRIYQSGVLLLGMSYGRPVLTSDLEPFKEVIIDSVNGYLFKNGDSIDLANKLENIITHKDDLTDVIANANHTIRQKFSWHKIALETERIYSQMI